MFDEVFEGVWWVMEVNGEIIWMMFCGVCDQQVLWVKEKGGFGINGGLCGDIFVYVYVLEKLGFECCGDDLYVEMEVLVFIVIVGGKVFV